jgi:hypothetical protein
LLPSSFAKITSWLTTPTADGETLANPQGADATLTDVNCLQYTEGGDADYVSLTNVITTSNAWELEFDVNWSDFGSEFSGVSFISNADQSRWLRINGDDGNNLFIEGRIGSTQFREFDISADVSLSLNVTYRIKTVWSGTSVAIYVDGVLKNTYNWVNNVESNTFSSIGRPTATSGTAKIANWKLTHNGVVEAYIPLQEGSGTKAYDVSGNGNHGVVVNSTWTTADGIESWNHQYGFTPAVSSPVNDGSVDTGVRIDSANIVLKTRFLWRGDNQNYLFGIYNATASQRFLFYQNNTQMRLVTPNGGHDLETVACIQNKFVDLEITSTSATLNGVSTQIDLTGVSQTADLRIFSNNVGTANADCDIQSFSIVKDGTLVIDYVSAQAGKFYDRVSNSLVSGTGSLVTNNIPALNTKTKQVIDFDGVADEVGTNYTPTGSDLVIDARVKFDSVTSQRTLWSCNANAGFWFRVENGSWDLYSRNAFIVENSTVITPEVGKTYDTRVEYNYSTGDWIARVKLSTDSTYTTIGTGNRLPPIINFEPVVLGQKGSSGYFDGQYHSFKLTEGGVTQVEYDFQNDIGTEFITDISGNGNGGIIAGGACGLGLFWGQRIPDSAGSIVSANYAIENGSTIINPAGFVHNGSECGVKLQKATKLNFYAGTTGIAYAPVALTAGTYDFEMEITITHRADHVDYRSFFGGWNVGGTNGCVTIHSYPNKVYLIAKATDGTVVATSSNANFTTNTSTFLSLFGIPTTYTVKRVGNTLKGFRNGVEQFSRDCTGKLFGNTFLNHYPIGYNGTSGTPDNTTLGVTVGDITYHRVRYTEGTSRDFEYNFSEASGNSLNDLSGNGNHGVVTSGAEGLVTRWSDSYIEYPADLHEYSFIPAQLIVTDCTDTSLNHTYTIEDTQNGKLRWVFNGDASTKIYFNTGSNRWTIQDSGGSVTKVGDTELPAEGSYGNGAVLAYSNHGLFLSTTEINITKLAQYDTDETTLTSTEKALNERYFG